MLNKCKNLTIENKTQLNYLQLKTKQMKNFKFLATALAALAIFSCSKEKIDAPDETGVKNVTVSIEVAGATPDSKQIDNEQTAAIKNGVYDAALYFLDDATQPNIVKAKILSPADILELLKPTGIKITEVPASAKKMYIVANYLKFNSTANVAYPTTFNTLATLKAGLVIKAKDQNERTANADANVPNSNYVVMQGLSGTFTGAGTEFSTGSVTIAPIVARIELHNVRLEGALTTPAGSAYKLQGIFINNFHRTMDLAGTGAGKILYKPTEKDVFIGGYPAGDNYLNDFTGAGWAEAGVAPANWIKAPGTSKIWGYNVFPATGGEANIPHIILKFINVNNSQAIVPADKVMWVTISKFKVANVDLTGFEAGKVYQIKDFSVPFDKATIDPETKNINVTATVTVAPWSVFTLVPTL